MPTSSAPVPSILRPGNVPGGGDASVGRIERMAARLLGASIARLCLLPTEGDDGAIGALVAFTRPDPLASLCEAVVDAGGLLTIADCTAPDMAATGVASHLAALGWRSMAATTLVLPEGRALGALIVGDTVPRDWSADDTDALADLVALLVDSDGGDSDSAPRWLEELARCEARLSQRRDEEKLALIFNSTSDLLFLVAVHDGPGGPEPDFTLVSVNDSFLAVTGLAEQDVIGGPPSSFLDAAAAARALERYRTVARTLEPLYYEEQLLLPVGELLVETTLTPIADDANRCTYLLGVAHDVTARRKAEDALRAAKEAAEAARTSAEQASQAKTDFLSRMSHELRTPLNSVIGFANVLRANRGNRLEERELSYLDRIVTNGQHLLTIVGDLLDISRVEAGKMPVHIAPVPLAPLVRTTVAAFEAELAGRPVTLVLDLPEDVRRLDTDATRLQQILINLVGNAIKFTDGGSITIRLIADPVTRDPLRLEVQDTGIGIPLHRQAAIFHAFEQAESVTTRSYGGTGLGLAISHSLCQLLGFRLAVSSAPGAGATFVIDFAPGDPPATDERLA